MCNFSSPLAKLVAFPVGRESSLANELAVAQQIDYVLVEDFPRGRSSHTLLTYSSTGTRTIPSSWLPGVPVLSQKLQRVSSRSTNRSIIKSTPVCHAKQGNEGGADIKIQPTWKPSKRRRRSRRDSSTRHRLAVITRFSLAFNRAEITRLVPFEQRARKLNAER